MTYSRRNLLAVVIPALVAAVVGLGMVVRLLPDKGVIVPPIAGGVPELAVKATVPVNPAFDRHFKEGVALLRTGRYGDSAEMFKAALRIAPHVPEAYVNLGFAYLGLGSTAAATAAFQKAIEIKPSQANAYFGLAEGLQSKNDIAGALGAMRTYVHLTPEGVPARRKAMAAVWELESALANRRAGTDGAGETNAASPAKAKESALVAAAPAVVPPFTLTGLDGVSVPFGRYAGKTVVLNVWATWCAPCRGELGSLQKLSEKLDNRAFAVIGISIDKDADFVREFLNDVKVRFPNYIDSEQSITRSIFNIAALPQTLLIGPDGTVFKKVVGVRAWDSPGEIAEIKRLSAGITRPGSGG